MSTTDIVLPEREVRRSFVLGILNGTALGGLSFFDVIAKTVPARRRGSFFAWRELSPEGERSLYLGLSNTLLGVVVLISG